jgi:hypothetical protein
MLSPSLASGGELGLRSLPEVLWSDQAEAAVASLGDGAEIEGELLVALSGSLARAFPEAWATGLSRSASNSMEMELTDLLHFGLRISRVQERAVHYGDAKTIFQIYLTGSLTLLNLGTGETLGSRTFTIVQGVNRVGHQDLLDDAGRAEGIKRAGALLVQELVAQCRARFQPGEIRAYVAGRHKKRAVLAYGFLDGASRGDVFSLEGGGNLRLTNVQERLSMGSVHGGVGLPKVGTELSRIGAPRVASDAPRLMVLAGRADQVVAPGVTGGELAQWVGDALVESGFTVIPGPAVLTGSQMSESGAVNVSLDKIVGAMTLPDILVIPSVLQHRVSAQRDEELGIEMFLVDVVLTTSFVDVGTGTVLYGTSVTDSRSELSTDTGRQIDPRDSFPGLIKDAALVLGARVGEEFKPRRAYGKISGPVAPNGTVRWKPEGRPLGFGTVAEVLTRSVEFKSPVSGESIGFVEEVSGTVKVVESRPNAKNERGRVIISTTPIEAGQRVRAVVGTESADTRIVRLGKIDVPGDSAVLSEDELRAVASAALETSGHFRAALDDSGLEVLKEASQGFNSGVFAVHSANESPVEPASHRMDITIRLSVDPLKRKGKRVHREFFCDISASLVNLESGRPETLLSPSQGAVEVYVMRQSSKLGPVRLRKGVVILGLREEDVPGHLRRLAFSALVDLNRRLRKLADKAEGQ